MTELLLLIAGGIAVLIIGADWAVAAGCTIAKRLGVSELVIGLTLTSIGTSLPELATSASAALASASDEAAAGVALGNLVGSNLFLVTALLGGSALIQAIPVEKRTVSRDGGALLLATLAAGVVMANGVVSKAEGIVLVCAYAVFLVVVVRGERRRSREAPAEEQHAETAETRSWLSAIPWWLFAPVQLAAGIAGVLYGAELVVGSGVSVAAKIGMPGTLIGLLVGVGTSLPELVVSVQAALRGSSDMSVGNIIGSGITNLLLCLGAASIAAPIAVAPSILALDVPYLMFATLVALALMRERLDVARSEGGVLVLLFVLFTYVRVFVVPA